MRLLGSCLGTSEVWRQEGEHEPQYRIRIGRLLRVQATRDTNTGRQLGDPLSHIRFREFINMRECRCISVVYDIANHEVS